MNQRFLHRNPFHLVTMKTIRFQGIARARVHSTTTSPDLGFESRGIPTLEVADSLDTSATQALQGVAALREQSSPDQKEFLSTLGDLESISLLGRSRERLSRFGRKRKGRKSY